MTKFAYRDAVTKPPSSQLQRWRPILPPPLPVILSPGNCLGGGASVGRWAGAGPPMPSPPTLAGGLGLGSEQNGRPRIGPRGALRRRSDPSLDGRSGLVAHSASGSQNFDARSVEQESRIRPNRGGSLECLQYVGHLVHDLLPNNHAAGDESDLSSEASSYSASAARSRRASLSVDSDGASSSGVSSLSSAGPATAPVALAVLADVALADAAAATPSVTPEIPDTKEDAEEPDLLDVKLQVVLDQRGADSPDYQEFVHRVVWYQGRNLLDLGWNVQSSPWPFQYAELPSASPHFFLQNRAQYHRLGPYGLQSPERLVSAAISPSDVDR